MSPSRGLGGFVFRRALSTFRTLPTSAAPVQIYISKTHNPFVNLSIEHHLFLTNPPTTTTLLLYTNSPCIVIGRNQNPWVEINLPRVLLSGPAPSPHIVRRRSGGGTVFHDLGNVNYSVAMPTPAFHRDTHAEMVVRALRNLGVVGAVVNERHDVVVLPEGTAVPETRMTGVLPGGTKKVSGSAYKVTTRRSYHHGTMLLRSQLQDVRGYLRSPAREWMRARGVDSVRSEVANAGVGEEGFVGAVVEEFSRMYGGEQGVEVSRRALETGRDGGDASLGVCWVGEEEVRMVEDIQKGVEELMSPEWVYGQTPQFTFSVPAPIPDPRDLIPPLAPSKDPLLSSTLPPTTPRPPEDSSIEITASKGVIESASSPIDNLVGKNFDGGTIADALKAKRSQLLGEWVESVLGRTQWGKT